MKLPMQQIDSLLVLLNSNDQEMQKLGEEMANGLLTPKNKDDICIWHFGKKVAHDIIGPSLGLWIILLNELKSNNGELAKDRRYVSVFR